METTMPVEPHDFESTKAWFDKNHEFIRDTACQILFTNRLNDPDFPTMSSHVLRRKIGATATFLERLCSASINKEVINYWSKFINQLVSEGTFRAKQMGNELHVTLTQQTLVNYTSLQNFRDNNTLSSHNLILSKQMKMLFSSMLSGQLTLNELEPGEADALIKSIENIEPYLSDYEKSLLDSAIELGRKNQSNIRNNAEYILLDAAEKMFPNQLPQ